MMTGEQITSLLYLKCVHDIISLIYETNVNIKKIQAFGNLGSLNGQINLKVESNIPVKSWKRIF